MIWMITGGARSGKSSYGQNLALSFSQSPTYLATARHWDGDFEKRIERHRGDRDQRWTLIEEEKNISKVIEVEKVYMIDCVTLWLTNFFIDEKNDIEVCLSKAKQEIDELAKLNATIIFITNELGMGVHAETEIGRKFVDLQGWVNQYLAQKSTKATLMVSGIPVQIK